MIKNKKTVWVINYFGGTPESGGGERHYYFSEYWIKMGWNVVIVSASYNHLFNNFPDAPHSYNYEDVEGRTFCWVKTPRYTGDSLWRFWSMFVFTFKVFFIKHKKLGIPDVIIVSSMPIFPILSGYWLKQKFKSKKLLFEIRDIWPLTLVYLRNLSHSHPAVCVMGWFERFGYRKADKVISLLPHAAQHINSISKDPSKFFYIPNGLSIEQLKEEPLSHQILSLLPKNKFLIGYTGSMSLANALEYLIEAAKILKDHPKIHFVLVGDGYLKEELQIASMGLLNVTFIPKIRKNQVQPMIEHFDVCFVGRTGSPLFQHGVSSNKYFDYMLAAKPVLDSNNFIKDPVELSGCGIIVSPDSPKAIADGATFLFKLSLEERRTLGLKGKSFVNKYHSIEKLSNDYLQLFI